MFRSLVLILSLILSFSLSTSSLATSKQQSAEEKQYLEMVAQIKSSVKPNMKELFYGNNNLVAGNSKSNLVIVEFYDYLCPYCKAQNPVLEKFIKNHSNVKVIFKQFPIHGEVAEYAAKAVIAAASQGNFLPLHNALLMQQDLTDQSILKIAEKVGLNVPKLTSAMDSAEVNDHLAADIALGKALNINVTPTLIVARIAPSNKPDILAYEVALGAQDENGLEQLIQTIQ